MGVFLNDPCWMSSNHQHYFHLLIEEAIQLLIGFLIGKITRNSLMERLQRLQKCQTDLQFTTSKKNCQMSVTWSFAKKNQTQTPRKIFVNERSILGHPCRELLMVQRLTWKRVRSAASTKKMMPSTWVVHAVPLYESRKWILKSIFCGTSDCTGHP